MSKAPRCLGLLQPKINPNRIKPRSRKVRHEQNFLGGRPDQLETEDEALNQVSFNGLDFAEAVGRKLVDLKTGRLGPINWPRGIDRPHRYDFRSI